MKKFFSLVLALVMALSLTTVAWGAEKLVSNAAELISTIATVQDGDVIKLTGNVTFNTTDRINVTGSYYDGVCYTGGASFTIDLGGYTITSDAGALNDYLLNIANKTTATANTITIKNGTLTAVSDVYSALCVGSSAATAPTTVNTENLTINGIHPEGAVVKIRSGATWNANAGTVVNSNGAYTALECSAATANINAGAKLDQTNSSAAPSVGSAIGVSGGGVVNVNGAEIGSDRYGAFVYPTGGTLNVISGTVTAPTALYCDEYTAGYYIADSVINVSGGTITGDVGFRGIDGGDPAISISGGTVDGDILANTGDDLTVSGGTFPNADVSAYLPSNLTQTTDGVVVSEGGAALANTYDLVTTDAAKTKTVGVTVNTYAAKAPRDADKPANGIQADEVGNVKYVEFSNMIGRYFVQVNSVGAADYTVYYSGTESVFGYFDEVASPFYYGNGVAFYNFGENCGQWDDTPVIGAQYYTFEKVLYVAVSAGEPFERNLMVGTTLTPVNAVTPVEWVGHVAKFTYDKNYVITAVECAECGTPGVIVPNYLSLPKNIQKTGTEGVDFFPVNDDDYYYWLAGPVADTETDKDDKVTSAETFDAGIALYVGMSVMAAAGSVVVLKKRED